MNMKDFQFWLTLGTATIPASISGLLSFLGSWMKNRSEIKQIENKHQNDLEKLEKQYKHDFEAIEKNHLQEIEKMKEAHKLELENIQKHSEAELANTVTKEFMSILGTAMAPALSKHLENTDIFNQPQK